MKKLLQHTESLYDHIKEFWEAPRATRMVSNFLVISFLIGIFYYGLIAFDILPAFSEFFQHPFFAIEISFTLLLIFELFSLLFALPRSVARSNLKQYELLSLIFLRSGFKEFSHIDELSSWTLNSEPITNMFIFGTGGLVIFVLVSLTGKIQRHVKITSDVREQDSFIRVKKLVALLLLLAFLLIGLEDVYILLTTGAYPQSFDTFYTILIFSDILIVLIALRYSTAYIRIFRYSAFVLATIIIRISFSLEALESVLVGVAGAVYVLLLTLGYNYYLKENES